MARKKKLEREEDEAERLQKQVRELKATNRSLLQRLKKLDKNYEQYLENETASKEESLAESTGLVTIKCSDCGKGTIQENNLAGRIFLSCTVCGAKGRKK